MRASEPQGRLLGLGRGPPLRLVGRAHSLRAVTQGLMGLRTLLAHLEVTPTTQAYLHQGSKHSQPGLRMRVGWGVRLDDRGQPATGPANETPVQSLCNHT